ncbi:hypothetical protein ACFL0M_04320 [Thermodesulfobacteriota bacterium]
MINPQKFSPIPHPSKKDHSEKPDLSSLRDVLPPFVARTHPRLKELTGYSGRSFANMDSKGQTNGVKRI